MKGSTFFKAASLLSSVFTPLVQAQTNDQYTDPGTNITFSRYTVDSSQTKGGLQWGYALPAVAGGTNDEYIGLLVGSLQTGHQGWSGLSHGGGMPNALLLMAYVDDAGARIKTEFKYAGGYVVPDTYTGNATITQISQKINATHFTLIYRCQWCWVWNQKGATGSQLPTTEVQVIGWAQNLANPSNPLTEHNNGQSQFGAQVAPARKADYAKWVAQYGGNGTTTPTPTPTSTPPPSGPTTCVGTPAPTETTAYDYIIVGGGAGGIPVAAKLAESGKSVLLIEKGPPSLGRWNGTMKPKWLEGTDLTRFDVPGLCNQIWVDSAGVACTDIDQMAGCVLGGGSAVNAALWWKAVPKDWDLSFPSGWKSSDMAAATDRVFKTIQGTDHPSMDGKLYYQQGYQVLTTALAADGWKDVTPVNSRPSEKNFTYGLAEFMYVNGQRNGPLATYLVDAVKRKNFKLWTNTAVRRVVRSGSKVTGVELDGGNGGYCGTVNLTATGRVILSAGTFGSTKLLFRSGIGPKDQLQIVASSAQDGASYINSSQWINLPVGHNLNDHVNTDLVVKHPNVTFYDFYAAWTTPIESDKQSYLNNRTGILAQSAPNIGPMFWQEVKGSDGIDRAIQWQARVEPSPPATDNTSMTISQYLGRGSTSRGTLSINGALSMYVSDPPYLKTKEDLEAVTTAINDLKRAIAKVPSIEWEVPAANVSTEDFLKSIPLTPSKRRSNHWIGTSKIGTDSGLSGGTSVVDLNTQVYGTDNLHVVDAGIFPGHIVTNPTAYIVVIAEHAAEKILALGGGKPTTPPPASSGTPVRSSTKAASPSGTAASGTVAAGKQCGGKNYTGPTQCVEGYTCKKQNSNYSYCAKS